MSKSVEVPNQVEASGFSGRSELPGDQASVRAGGRVRQVRRVTGEALDRWA